MTRATRAHSRPVVKKTPKPAPKPKYETESYSYNHKSRNNLKRGKA